MSDREALTKEQEQLDEHFIAQALRLAQSAFDLGEVPVGALVVAPNNDIIGQGWNQPISCHDPTAHAEIQAIRQAGRSLSNYRLVGCTIYVSLEPCTMCVGAIVHSRVKRIVFGALEPKAGAVISANRLLEEDYFNHRLEWRGGVLEEQCGALMTDFFAKRRAAKKNQARSVRQQGHLPK